MIRHRSRFAWGGVTVLLALGTMPAHADEKGEALLKEVETATKAAKTLSADLTMSYNAKDAEGKSQTMKMAAAVKLKKPNLARIEFEQNGIRQNHCLRWQKPLHLDARQSVPEERR